IGLVIDGRPLRPGSEPQERGQRFEAHPISDALRVLVREVEEGSVLVEPVQDWKLVSEPIFAFDRLPVRRPAGDCRSDTWLGQELADTSRLPFAVARSETLVCEC